MNKLGFWKEFHFRGDNLPSIFEKGNLEKREEKIKPNVLKYLKSGIWLVKTRSVFNCVITEERIGYPCIYTDGEWFWTSEYIYYYENYNLEMPEEFIKTMESNCFKIKEEIGKEKINTLTEYISSWGF